MAKDKVEEQVLQEKEAVEVEQKLVDQILVKHYEDQFVVQRLDEEGNVVAEDPVADPTMLDELEKAVDLIKEKIQYLKMRNAAYEAQLLIMDRIRAENERAQAEVQMPEEK